MECAIIKTGGKQHKVSKDSTIEVERLALKQGENFFLDEVLLYVKDKKIKLGKPTIKGVRVKATILEHTKGNKLRIAKFKAKVRHRRITGHRQKLTKIKILDILTAVKN